MASRLSQFLKLQDLTAPQGAHQFKETMTAQTSPPKLKLNSTLYGDPYKLVRDGDGTACESLP